MNWVEIGAVGTVVGAGVATYMAYLSRRSARDSERAAARAAEIQAELIDLQTESIRIQAESIEFEKAKQWEHWVTVAVEDFRIKGTPVYCIHSLQSLSEEEKEKLWQEVFLRYRYNPPRETFKEASKNIKV